VSSTGSIGKGTGHSPCDAGRGFAKRCVIAATDRSGGRNGPQTLSNTLSQTGSPDNTSVAEFLVAPEYFGLTGIRAFSEPPGPPLPPAFPPPESLAPNSGHSGHRLHVDLSDCSPGLPVWQGFVPFQSSSFRTSACQSGPPLGGCGCRPEPMTSGWGRPPDWWSPCGRPAGSVIAAFPNDELDSFGVTEPWRGARQRTRSQYHCGPVPCQCQLLEASATGPKR
jgi:hypothetical protein